MITTVTGVGLIALDGVAFFAVQGSWRLVWAGSAAVGERAPRRRLTEVGDRL
ncbi:hypothetical protein [Dietzia sp. ANT_WB102]|uniref:hypothetical protein n=1 Tax=Dietzia sp. ANT_WB102 TaxID=2597345 RepID=UPI00165D61A7|nr:hypothetical protein [Dietzia sp. ANT_WB102]